MLDELSSTELTLVSGGFRACRVKNEASLSDSSSGGNINYAAIGVGAGVIALGVAVVATGGLAAVPLGVLGAATAGEATLIGFSLGLSGLGGFAIGDGLTGG